MAVQVHLAFDCDGENPSEWDGWRLSSFGRRHRNFRDPKSLGLSLELDGNGWPKVKIPGLRAKLRAGLAFFVSYYQHSQCVWFLPGEGPDCPWDSVRCAGLLVWEQPVENLGPKTYADRQQDARNFLKTYTAWCNDEVFYFRIEDEDGNALDSCGGWYEPEEMFKAIAETVQGQEVVFKGEAAWLANHHSLRLGEPAGSREF
jgi:hypothetical protein